MRVALTCFTSRKEEERGGTGSSGNPKLGNEKEKKKKKREGKLKVFFGLNQSWGEKSNNPRGWGGGEGKSRVSIDLLPRGGKGGT